MINYIIILSLLITILIILKIIMTTKIKVLKSFQKNEELDILAKRLPDNITLCEQILEMINSKNVKIEENKDSNTCIYTIFNDKITISTKQAQYTRLQTIAHECIHSIQNKKLLWFNFIFTNIYLIYFLIILILTTTKFIQNGLLQILILTILSFVQYAIRSYLETDSMIKAKILAEEYIDKYSVYTVEEKKEFLSTYQKLNSIGIPFTNYILLFNNFVKVIIYTVLVMIVI